MCSYNQKRQCTFDVGKEVKCIYQHVLDYRYCANCGRHCGHKAGASQCIICDAVEKEQKEHEDNGTPNS